MNNVYFIAEAGVNHNGSVELAKELIEAAKNAGASAIKFQTFITEELVTPSAKQAKYQTENTKEQSQFEMLKSLELSFSDFYELQQYARQVGIDFLSTPFDLKSASFLVDDLNMELIKISSGDLTNLPLLFHVAKSKVKMIVSTGMSTEDEIEKALITIAYGLDENPIFEWEKAVQFFETDKSKQLLREFVTLLHCTSEYPTPYKNVQLASIDYLKKKTQLNIGLSDHSKDSLVSIVAVSRGVNVIEKHFTLDKTLPGPDHVASLNPEELSNLIEMIHQIPIIIGEDKKMPTEEELKTKQVVQKSLVANKVISQGELFTMENTTIKRPGNGMSPNLFWTLLGREASKDYVANDLIDEKIF